jgi:hypothetical protein
LLTTGPPIASKFRRLDAAKLAAAKAEFAQLEKDGIVRRSCSPWATPLHMVEKADGSWRPCGDYRRLNLVTVPDSYPIPNMMDFSAKISGCKFFTKIDLRKGYHQIEMNEDDIPKTAITTPFGLFEYTRMTFGLRNAGNTFQRLMDRVLGEVEPAFAYLDDVLISSPDAHQHELDVRQTLRALQAAGLVINADKCVFGATELDFLGHHITAEGITPLSSSIAAIRDYPRPSTTKQLQGFLGVVNFYRKFVPAAARTLKPLTDALRGKPRPSAAVEWSEERVAAFQAAKDALCNTVQLAHPDPAAELAIMVDASADHVGAPSSSAVHRQPLGNPWDFSQRKWSPPRPSTRRSTGSCSPVARA